MCCTGKVCRNSIQSRRRAYRRKNFQLSARKGARRFLFLSAKVFDLSSHWRVVRRSYFYLLILKFNSRVYAAHTSVWVIDATTGHRIASCLRPIGHCECKLQARYFVHWFLTSLKPTFEPVYQVKGSFAVTVDTDYLVRLAWESRRWGETFAYVLSGIIPNQKKYDTIRYDRRD